MSMRHPGSHPGAKMRFNRNAFSIVLAMVMLIQPPLRDLVNYRTDV